MCLFQAHPQRTRFDGLADAIAREVRATAAILDGEIVCLAPKDGHSRFLDLIQHRAEPYFYTFDLLSLEGKDLRALPRVERKFRLRAIRLFRQGGGRTRR